MRVIKIVPPEIITKPYRNQSRTYVLHVKNCFVSYESCLTIRTVYYTLHPYSYKTVKNGYEENVQAENHRNQSKIW